MRPNDDSGKLPVEQRPFRVLLISGSDRRQYNCPGVDSKSRSLMLRMAQRLPQDWEIDYEDLGNVYGRESIRSCNACVSTSMALCVWPCNCYEKSSTIEPDLMWNMDMYARLDLADAWAIIGPVNWYGPSSNLKAMFDRLVCMNGGNPREDLIAHKDPEKAMALEHTSEWEELSLNHLEGRTAAFFCYGDGGGDEIDNSGRPRVLQHKHYFDPVAEPFERMRDSYAPLVWQCRYGGVEVPDQLWAYREFGLGKKYSENQAEQMIEDKDTIGIRPLGRRFRGVCSRQRQGGSRQIPRLRASATGTLAQGRPVIVERRPDASGRAIARVFARPPAGVGPQPRRNLVPARERRKQTP